LTQVCVERIGAFFQTRTINRIKFFGFITRRALVRIRSNAVLTRRVTEVADSIIVKITLRAVIKALSFK
jgi:hypothetical protein